MLMLFALFVHLLLDGEEVILGVDVKPRPGISEGRPCLRLRLSDPANKAQRQRQQKARR